MACGTKHGFVCTINPLARSGSSHDRLAVSALAINMEQMTEGLIKKGALLEKQTSRKTLMQRTLMTG
jgi:hypothetical protein